MAVGATITLDRGELQGSEGVVAPVGLSGNWKNIIDGGGVATADNASITNPSTQIVTATTHVFSKTTGTFVSLRLLHQGTGTLTSPVVVLFGRNRKQTGTAFRRLYNQDATPIFAVTLTCVLATDLTETFAGPVGSTGNPYGLPQGNYQATDVNPKTHVWDMMECDEFLVGVQTAFNDTNNLESNCVVQAVTF